MHEPVSLIYGGAIDATPMVSWRAGALQVTAVKLTNHTNQPQMLDPRNLRGAFSLLGRHFQARGVSVNQVTLNPSADVSLPPFADAIRVLDKEHRARPGKEPDDLVDDDDGAEDETGRRDILGEMEIAAC